MKLVFKEGVRVDLSIGKLNSFKVFADHKREPTEDEYYCLQLGYWLSHTLTVVRQLEHTILYMSNFSPSDKMKRAGINRHTHLLWSVENYIIRTQSVYDRILILTDRLFHIQNNPNRISHESIITNSHISMTKIPNFLKEVKAAVKKYYHDRNTIIHESSYVDGDIRKIEAYSILASSKDYDEFKVEDINDQLKLLTKEYLKRKTREFARINVNVCVALSRLFSEMLPIFTAKYQELCKKNC